MDFYYGYDFFPPSFKPSTIVDHAFIYYISNDVHSIHEIITVARFPVSSTS